MTKDFRRAVGISHAFLSEKLCEMRFSPMDSSALKVLDARVSKLTAAYEGTTGEQARHVAEELNQLTMLSEVLKEIDAKTSAKSHPELELLRSKLESAASKLIAIDWADPERDELANDIAALLMLAHSVNRHER